MSQYKSNKIVAFLDITGFGNMVEKYPIEEVGARYQSVIRKSDELIREDGEFNPLIIKNFPVEKHVFSDSIILFSHDDSRSSCLSIIHSTRRIMEIAVAHSFLIRGGLTFGEMFIEREKNIFLGKPLIKAYKFEQQQEWFGVSIDQSLELKFPDIFKPGRVKLSCLDGSIIDYPYFYFDAIRYPVPFKCGSTHFNYTINWLVGVRDKDVQKDFASVILDFDRNSIPSDAIKKYENTIEYIKHIRNIITIHHDFTREYHSIKDKYSEPVIP